VPARLRHEGGMEGNQGAINARLPLDKDGRGRR
jgi:hypothetical protein